MARLPLVGGAYQAQSIIANAQRCVNLYPEKNAKDAPVPLTYYQRPGLVAVAQGDNAPVRGIHRSSQLGGYTVIGQKVYYINQDLTLTQIGTLAIAGTLPTKFVDNGVTGLLVDGTSNGYSIDIATHAFALVVDPTMIFAGANFVDYLDTFILWNLPNSPTFGSTLSNELVFDATYTAAKTAWPDLLQGIIVNRLNILLIGVLKSEIWYNAGNALFPFARAPGTYIEHGTIAPYTIAAQDIEVYWLSQDLQGHGVVVRQQGYETSRISNHALEYQLSKLSFAELAAAKAYTYQQLGHVFYVLMFASQTWVYDASSDDPTVAWHQRAFSPDGGATLQRVRDNCGASVWGFNLVGDYANGTIYSADPSVYSDTVGGIPYPIACVRTFPHISEGESKGQATVSDGKRMVFKSFVADIEAGNVDANGNPLNLSMRFSPDRGATWGATLTQPLSSPQGNSYAWPRFGNAGQSRDLVYELSWSFAGKTALNGAWVEVEISDQNGA